MLKLIKCCLCIALTASVLSGCASKEEIAKQEATKVALAQEKEAQQELQTQLTEKIARLEESAKQWQEVQPGVERLVNIEGELNDLIAQLNAIIVQAENKKQIANKKTVTPAKKVNPPAPTGKGGTYYALQLSSLSSAEKVESAWSGIYKKNSSTLSSYQPLVETIKINGKVYYRIKAGKFSSKNEAKSVCEQLKNTNTSCLTSLYSGETMQQFKSSNNL